MHRRDLLISLAAGVLAGRPTLAQDEELLARVTSASVSCGAHAGTPADIDRTLTLASHRGVVVGAHPGYADPANFGRVDQDLTDDQILALIDTHVQDPAVDLRAG